MDTAASTTTRDILGLALLAVLSARPSSRSEAVDAVRGLCLPWLTPIRHQIACAEAEFDALAHASRTDPRESSVLVHSHCHQIARAQAELDALGGEPREDKRDAVPLVSFPT